VSLTKSVIVGAATNGCAMTSAVPIFLYHAVSDNPPGWVARYTVSPATFAAQLDLVVASGRVPLTVSGYVDGQRDGTLPERPVLITVDDGFADFASAALPILAERNLPSTLYVTTGALADRRRDSVLPAAAMLQSSDLPGLEAAGVEIGAHSHTHRQLDLLTPDVLADDIFRSRDMLADVLGHHIRSFAYPHGYWRARVRRLVAAAGFDSACGLAQTHSFAGEHPLALSRLMLHADTSVSTVAAWLSGSGARIVSPRRRVLSFGWRQYRRARQLHSPGFHP
jgi:peptidoglycan/xylan/chitin deacetylase (PgdA/CDA1 family)